MSNLPHPLGDTNPGEMFYPGSPTVLASDTPSAGGSRAVDFGEDGLSSAVNRGLYALVKNDEYQEARLEQDIARPNLLTFTPAGGNGGNFTFSVDVWCGDTAYTPEDQSVRNGLISVLDQYYNDLVDLTSGDMIVVKEILDAPAGSSQVGSGFVTNPYITFRKMNPVTGALGADYVIPDGTKVWLAYGQKSQLDQLVGGSSGELQDAWFRGFTRSIGEIHAASFLKDGSRKATGSFDMDSNNLTEVGTVQGVDTSPLVLRGTGVAGHVDLYSDDLVRFRDQYNPSYVPLNDGAVGVDGYYSSMLTSLNSKSNILGSYMGNRLLSKSGLFSYNAGTGQLDWPELDVVLDGEQRTIAAGNMIVTSGSTQILVVDASGTVVERSQYSELLGTDIPLEVHYWTGAAFTTAFDVRWTYNGTSRNIEISCGNGANSDFGEYELDKACQLAEAFSGVSYEWDAGPSVVRIRGVARAPSTAPYNIQLNGNGLRLEGEGPGMYSTIYSDITNGHTVDLFDCNSSIVHVKNLTIAHAGNVQATTLGCFKNPGSRSTFKNVTISKDWGGTWDVGFANGLIWINDYNFDLRIENVRFQACRHSAIMGSGTGTDFMNLGFLYSSVIRNCTTGQGVGQLYGFVVNGKANRIENCTVSDGVDTYGMIVGGDNVVDGCTVRMTGAATAGNACIYYRPTPSQTYGRQLKIDKCYFWDAEYGITSWGINDTSWIARITCRDSEFYQCDKPFNFASFVAVHASSSIVVDGCTTYDSVDFIAKVNNMWHARFNNNIHYSVGGDGYWIDGNGGACITNNFIEGYGSGGSLNNAIEISVGAPRCEIHGNVIGVTGAPSGSKMVQVWRRTNITDNQFLGGGLANSGCLLLNWFLFLVSGADNCTVSGNQFDNFVNYGVQLNGGANGCRIENNSFTNGAYGCKAVNVLGAVHAVISGNFFNLLNGNAITVDDNGGGGNGESCAISNNILRDVKGTDGSVGGIHGIAITQSAGGCRSCVISGNVLQNIGEDVNIPGWAWYGIYSNAEGTLMTGNIVRGITAYSGAGGLAVGFRMDNEGSMVGNVFDFNIGAGQTAQTMYGFEIVNGAAGPNVCNGNYAYIRGSNGSGAGKTTRGFYFWNSEKISVVGNVISEWTHTGASNLAMEGSGTQNLFVGNYDAGSAGVSISTSKPTQVGYSSNLATPRGDMNTSFGPGF